MFCRYCGKENEDGVIFCTSCGRQISADVQEVKETEEVKKAKGTGSAPKGIVAAIVIIAAVLALFGALIFFFIKSGATGPKDFLASVKSMFLREVKEEAAEPVPEPEPENIAEPSPAAEPEEDTAAAKPRKEREKSDDTDTWETIGGNEKEPYSEEHVDDGTGGPEESDFFYETELFPVTAFATSELDVASKDNATYYASNVLDNSFKTAWVEGADGNGEGHSITLRLDGMHRISKLRVYNGYLKTKRRYAINGRVSKALIDYGNGYIQHVDLNVMYPPEEEVDFSPSEMGETIIYPEKEVRTDNITLSIVEVVPGSKYTDTAITEIDVFGE